jgi:hypothetical protein
MKSKTQMSKEQYLLLEKRQPKVMQASIWFHGFEFKSGTKEEKPLLFGASLGQCMGCYHSKCRDGKNVDDGDSSSGMATVAAAAAAAAAAAVRAGQSQRVIADGEGRWEALSDI